MNLGLPEMIFIFVIALIIFGPKKLPEIGRQIGKAMTEFKRASNEFKSQIEGEIRNLELDETVKRQPVPQILPPQASVVNTAPVPDISVAGNPAAPDAIVGDVPTPPEISAADTTPPTSATPVAENPEQAKAADV
jgi:sec-independent protein translocase protein TatB